MARTKVGERIRVNFYFDAATFDALRRLATLRNTTYSELIRTSVREFVVREGQRAIDAGQIIKDIRK